MKSDNEKKELEMGYSRDWWSAEVYVCTCVSVHVIERERRTSERRDAKQQ